ncbi:hypothetical protein [Tunicatimonas pelagia]|uniref:hypothetical protein n=1 Tax=Tunicatimonas pelagia TaxID=931531 RepID=UPI002665AFFE|nr:hypothetical protein [Tunicatimonas pelagia]WKN41009.1 hypothetical protein P0M28_18405 [Tunicatimonas pelagia]
MKKLAFTLVVGCLSLGAVANNNLESSEADVSISLSGQHAVVVVRDWNVTTNTPASIKVLDNASKTVYQEAVNSGEQHAKRYNFSQMEPGKYTLVLESKKGKVRKPFIVGLDGSVREDKSEIYQSFAPIVVKPKSDRTSVHIAFKNIANAPLKLAVLSNKGEILYSEEVLGQQEYNKKVNLKNLRPGSYTLALYNADYSYYKNVNNY